MSTTHIAIGPEIIESDITDKQNKKMETIENNKTEITSQSTQVPGCNDNEHPKLTNADIYYEETQVAIVNKWLDDGTKTAQALYRIKTYKGGIIWTRKYDKWEDYVFETFGLKSSQTSDLLRAAEFDENVTKANSARAESNTLPIKGPKNPAQVKALREIKTDEHKLEFWADLVAHRDPDSLTASAIKAEVTVYLSRKGLEPKKNKVQTSCLGRINSKISELNEVLKKHPTPKLFEPLIQQLKFLVNPEIEIEVIPADSGAIPDSEIEPGDPSHRPSIAGCLH